MTLPVPNPSDARKIISRQLRRSKVNDVNQKGYASSLQRLLSWPELSHLSVINYDGLWALIESKEPPGLSRAYLKRAARIWCDDNARVPTLPMRLRLICPYCQSFAYLKDSTPIYGESRGLKYICSNFASGCDAYVGIHKGDHIPLGRPADKKLRKKRRKCHQEFDFLMKQNPSLSKTEAYELVAQLMGIPVDDCHIALFDEELAEQFLTCIYKHLAVKD